MHGGRGREQRAVSHGRVRRRAVRTLIDTDVAIDDGSLRKRAADPAVPMVSDD